MQLLVPAFVSSLRKSSMECSHEFLWLVTEIIVMTILMQIGYTTHCNIHNCWIPTVQAGACNRKKYHPTQAWRFPNWKEWLNAEFKQLDSMAKQEMYGAPVHAPRDAIVLRQHKNYAIKGARISQARKRCNGSPRSTPHRKLANTYFTRNVHARLYAHILSPLLQ